MIAALVRSGSTTTWVWATALAGVVAAVSYWKLALKLDTAKR